MEVTLNFNKALFRPVLGQIKGHLITETGCMILLMKNKIIFFINHKICYRRGGDSGRRDERQPASPAPDSKDPGQ